MKQEKWNWWEMFQYGFWVLGNVIIFTTIILITKENCKSSFHLFLISIIMVFWVFYQFKIGELK